QIAKSGRLPSRTLPSLPAKASSSAMPIDSRIPMIERFIGCTRRLFHLLPVHPRGGIRGERNIARPHGDLWRGSSFGGCLGKVHDTLDIEVVHGKAIENLLQEGRVDCGCSGEDEEGCAAGVAYDGIGIVFIVQADDPVFAFKD